MKATRIGGIVAGALLVLASPGSRADAVGHRHARAETAARVRARQLLKAPHVEGELLVKLRGGAGEQTLERVEKLGLRVERRPARGAPVVRARAESDAHAADALARLLADPSVEYAEPNYLYSALATPNDPLFRQQWGLSNGTGADIGAVGAWDVTTGSDDVVVGVVDSGVDLTHPDLADNLYTNAGEIAGNGLDDDANGYADDVHGWDAIEHDGTPQDENGHGTHVSGTIGARGDNGIGIAGVNWRVKVMSLRFLRAEGYGTLAGALESIDYAVSERRRGVNLRVLNNSWGGGPYSFALEDAISEAEEAGILFVVAAGNSGNDNDRAPSFPDCYDIPNVLSVGAMNRDDAPADFTNFGRLSVDLYAPGVDVLSTVPGGGYEEWSGTSMAAPHVAGVAALVAAAYPGATCTELKARLLGSAVPTPYGRDSSLAGGRASAARALRPGGGRPDAVADFRVTSSTAKAVSLAWTAVRGGEGDGAAVYSDIRWSLEPITEASFGAATQISDARPVQEPGAGETAVVRGCFPAGAPVYVAMRVYGATGGYAQSATLTALPEGADVAYAVLPGPADSGHAGEALNLRGDDLWAPIDLPFAFPFFGAEYDRAYVTTNGMVSFAAPFVGSQPVIMPLTSDLRTDGPLRPDEDVYLDVSSDRVTIRWVAEPWILGEAPKSARAAIFAVTLHADGRVDVVYGPEGGGDFTAAGAPAIGISDGTCAPLWLAGEEHPFSYANLANLTFLPLAQSEELTPVVALPSVSSVAEGATLSATVTASEPRGGPVTLTAVLPRNATFDPSTGALTFAPDSGQAGAAPLVFTASTASGRVATSVLTLEVVDNPRLPEIEYLAAGRKLVVGGAGFARGADVEIDGQVLADTKSNRRSPATRLTSKTGASRLAPGGLHAVVVINPDGVRSGPSFVRR